MIALQASRFAYYHRNLDGSGEEIAAMDRMQELTLATGFGGDRCFAYSQFYLTYSTNKVNYSIFLIQHVNRQTSRKITRCNIISIIIFLKFYKFTLVIFTVRSVVAAR